MDGGLLEVNTHPSPYRKISFPHFRLVHAAGCSWGHDGEVAARDCHSGVRARLLTVDIREPQKAVS